MSLIQRLLIIAVVSAIPASWAGAASLSLQPAIQAVSSGETFSVELLVSGLGDTVPPALGDFEVDIAFEPAALTFAGYTLGTMLGDIAMLDALDVSFGETGAGVVNIAEVSLLAIAELNTLQPSTFVLATLDFTATGLVPGQSTSIDIRQVLALGDASGNPLMVDGLTGATVAAVPLPAALWLLVAALCPLVVGRRRIMRQVVPQSNGG